MHLNRNTDSLNWGWWTRVYSEDDQPAGWAINALQLYYISLSLHLRWTPVVIAAVNIYILLFILFLHAASFCADLQKFLDMNNWMIIERTGWLISAALAQFIHWIDFVHYSSLILSSEFCEQTSGAVLMCVCVCCVWLESIPLLALACLWIHTPDPHMREKTQLRGSVA